MRVGGGLIRCVAVCRLAPKFHRWAKQREEWGPAEPLQDEGEAKGRGPTMEGKGREGRPRTAQMGPPATAPMRRPMRSDG